MAVTQDMIDKLEGALAKGVTEVESDGERIRFAGTADLLKTLAYLRDQIAASDPYSAGPVREVHAWYDSEW